jgi:hypothetical protein
LELLHYSHSEIFTVLLHYLVLPTDHLEWTLLTMCVSMPLCMMSQKEITGRGHSYYSFTFLDSKQCLQLT